MFYDGSRVKISNNYLHNVHTLLIIHYTIIMLGINMTIYEGEITAILGHNGAGKTTLFNILTGLTEPTSGTIKVFGYDVRNSSDVIKIRRMIGVCPQYDILFERLTPREHLKFFATLRVSIHS
jgi:ATP-binding cassette, subfamily A (ABC1), member 5